MGIISMTFALSGATPAINIYQPQTRQKTPDDPVAPDPDTPNKDTGGEESVPRNAARPEPASLNPRELQKLQALKARDQEVKNHEMAHLSAAGGLATGGASFQYQQGPDGVRYAVGGEVGIDTSPVPGDPAATLNKAEQIRRAALAPANPSPQDQRVAAKAAAMAARARAELVEQFEKMGSLNDELKKSPRDKIHISV